MGLESTKQIETRIETGPLPPERALETDVFISLRLAERYWTGQARRGSPAHTYKREAEGLLVNFPLFVDL